MNVIAQLLHRSIVEPFFKQHAGLFLFSFFILFGIQPSAVDVIQFHYSLILSILDSVSFFFIAFGIWMIYAIKVNLFIRACLRKEAYDFIYLLNGINEATHIRSLIWMLVKMMAPVLLYGGVVLFIGILQQHWLSSLAVVTAILLLMVISVIIVRGMIRNGKANQLMRKSRWKSFRPGLFSFLLQFVFRKQFITLLILKTVSFTVLYFFAKTDSQLFEGRMLWLLFITVLSGHGIIIHRNFHFMENELVFHRNLPLSRLHILLSLLGIYCVLLIPEWWALKGVIIIQHDAAQYGWLILTGPAVLLLIHSLLYSDDLKMEDFLALLFGIWIVFIFFSLSTMKWLMPLIAGGMGGMIFFLSYYRFEKKIDIEKKNTPADTGSP
ncbi:MAG: hypothetical protein ABW007_11880 [Chitinophagaceae bacterium]